MNRRSSLVARRLSLVARRSKPVFCVLVYSLWSIVFSLSCVPKKLTVRATATLLENGRPAIEQESDVEMARTSSVVLLKQVEGLVLSDPNNKKLLGLLARGYASYAFGFIEEEEFRRRESLPLKAEFYRRGLHFGLRTLSISKDAPFDTWKRAVAHLNKKDVPAMFWTAFNWAGLIRLKTDAPENLVDLSKANLLMERVRQLDPTYHYGMVDVYFGIQEAMKPAIVGGDPKKAKQYFEEAMAKSGEKFLMAPLLYYQFFASQRDEEATTAHGLEQKIFQFDVEQFPEQRLANILAKRRLALLQKEYKHE